MEKALPAIPAKRYFTIGEVSELCGVKPYVLRYWEQEFTQLKPMKRRGNRRYYQHHEVLLIRRIRELLYEQGFTISGARNRLVDVAAHRHEEPAEADLEPSDEDRGGPHGERNREPSGEPSGEPNDEHVGAAARADGSHDGADRLTMSPAQVRQELISIRGLLAP